MGAIRNPDGSRQVLPSEIESLAGSHGLTIPEAEVLSMKLAAGGDVDALVATTKTGRVEYRQAYEQVPATAENHPLQAQDGKKAAESPAKAGR